MMIKCNKVIILKYFLGRAFMVFKLHAPVHDETRIITRFLLFPRCAGNELRWFCLAKIQQRFEGMNWADDGWHDECFIN
jgi:hypothetical protein